MTAAACVAAAGTSSASAATMMSPEGCAEPSWLMISHSPVPVIAMSRSSCQAVCHFTSPRFRRQWAPSW